MDKANVVLGNTCSLKLFICPNFPTEKLFIFLSLTASTSGFKRRQKDSVLDCSSNFTCEIVIPLRALCALI